MDFNFIYFINFRNTGLFVWNDQDHTFDLWEHADSDNPHKYEFTGTVIPEYVKEAFEKEGCIADKNGIQIGNFETLNYGQETEETFDVIFDNDQNSNSKGWKQSFQFCMDYIDQAPSGSYFEDYKGGWVSIVSNTTGERIFGRTI